MRRIFELRICEVHWITDFIHFMASSSCFRLLKHVLPTAKGKTMAEYGRTLRLYMPCERSMAGHCSLGIFAGEEEMPRHLHPLVQDRLRALALVVLLALKLASVSTTHYYCLSIRCRQRIRKAHQSAIGFTAVISKALLKRSCKGCWILKLKELHS